MEHLCQPVHRAFFIRSAHALNERADCVVVRVACAIVHHGFLLNAFLRNGEREMNYAARIRRGRQYADLERV